MSGHHLQRLGHVLAHLHDLGRPTAGAGSGSLDDHTLARQIGGERLFHRMTPVKACHFAGLGRSLVRLNGVLGGCRLQLLELKLQLINEPGGAFGTAAILLTLEQGDFQLKGCDDRLRGRDHRAMLGENHHQSDRPDRKGRVRRSALRRYGGAWHS